MGIQITQNPDWELETGSFAEVYSAGGFMTKEPTLAERLTVPMDFTGEEPTLIKPPPKAEKDCVYLIERVVERERQVAGKTQKYKVRVYVRMHEDGRAHEYVRPKHASWYASRSSAEAVSVRLGYEASDVVSYTPETVTRKMPAKGV